MDRPLDPGVKRGRLLKQAGILVVCVATVIVTLVALRGWLTPALKADRIRTAVATEGPLEVTVTAAGTVVPMHEEVISSPIASNVVKIHKQAGEPVRRGEPILELDASGPRLALGNLEEQIALQQNARRTQELELRRTLIDMQGRQELKRIDREARQARLDRLERLYDDGLAAEDELLEARLDIRRIDVELRQLEESIANQRDSMKADLARIELETSILLKQRDEQQRMLDLATAAAQRDGVVTFTVDREGTSVTQGAVLARVADLTRFQVQATLSDVYAQTLSIGQPARVTVGGDRLSGTLATIRPTVEGGALTVIVRLDEPSHPALRANQRVDAYVITAARDRAVLVRQGPFVNGAGPQQVFVVRDRRAYRTPVEVGLESYDSVEIVSGLVPGDEVIISDMRGYLHMDEVAIH